MASDKELVSLPKASPAWSLSVPDLLACITQKLGLSLRSVAGRLGVDPSTTDRWSLGDTRPTPEHHRALVALHDSQFCAHTRLRYICDHIAPAVVGAYDDAPLDELISIEELKSLRWDPDSVPGGTRHLQKLIVTAIADLPDSVYSRSYEVVREGPPIYIVLHRPGDELAAIPELQDHILKGQSAQGKLPVFQSAGTILPPPQNQSDIATHGVQHVGNFRVLGR